MNTLSELGNMIFDKAEAFTSSEYVEVQNLLKKVYDHIKSKEPSVDPYRNPNPENIVWRLTRWYEELHDVDVGADVDMDVVCSFDVFDNMNFKIIADDLSEIHIKFSRPWGEAYALMSYINQNPNIEKYLIQTFFIGPLYPFEDEQERVNWNQASSNGNAVVVVKLDMRFIFE